jgi:hypothetical protein
VYDLFFPFKDEISFIGMPQGMFLLEELAKNTSPLLNNFLHNQY